MRIFHFRILMDNAPDVFRDIEIRENSSFLELHDTIMKAFSFSGMEMASFYASNNDWDKGEEIALMDMMDDIGAEPVRAMSDTLLSEMMEEEGSKMLYLYDFMRMWIFYVELVSIQQEREGAEYPEVVLLVGNAPLENSKKEAGPMPFDMDEDNPMFDSEYELGEDEGGYESFEDTLDF